MCLSGTQRPLQLSLPDLLQDGLRHIRCFLYAPAGFSQSPFPPCFSVASLGSCDPGDDLVLLMGGARPRHHLPYFSQLEDTLTVCLLDSEGTGPTVQAKRQMGMPGA